MACIRDAGGYIGSRIAERAPAGQLSSQLASCVILGKALHVCFLPPFPLLI